MKRNTLFFLLAGACLAVWHYLALELHLYWRYLWFDIPMHALGGVVVALGLFTLKDLFPRSPRWLYTFPAAVLFVLFVALAWELFEVSIGVIFEESRYVVDTTTDLIVGLLGGAFGYFVGSKRKRKGHE